MSLSRRIRWFALALVIMLAVLVGFAVDAKPAQAATTGYVYICFPNWPGWNAVKGGSVKSINASVGNLWSCSGDYGDDKIYAKVYLGQKNIVTFQNWVYKGWGIPPFYMDPAGQVAIYPTRNGQTFWVGILGWQTRN